MIAHLWELIQDLSAKGWEVKADIYVSLSAMVLTLIAKVPFLPRPYKWFDKEFSSALQVCLLE